ncbi:putative mechanosensitive ion channel [Rosellinia necatrix]|uniref:Putative mechanosensitive ion channel n=1 Tax=Rosellinia necatrix TaxID=77044 RepID=A0A1W2TP09_ROSNE|nr:putative mechanosensitive ion channel [Rosellinia necatrix]
MPDGDIPLTQIRSNASSTGARKANQGLSTSFEQPEGLDGNGNSEKHHHFFHRGRRQAKKKDDASSEDELASNELSLNAMGRLYNRIIHASGPIRYLFYIVPVAILLAIPIIVLAVLDKRNDIPVGTGPDGAKGPSLFVFFIWIEVGWLTLWGGKLVAWLLAPAFMFFTGVISPGTRKYAALLRNLQIPLSLFFWALADWLVFINLLQRGRDKVSWVNTVAKILGAAFVSSAIFLGEKAFVQLISISYHQRSFANRIQDSKRDVHLLGMMYDASRKLFPMYCEQFLEEDEIINDSIEMLLAGNKRKRNKRPAIIPAKLIGNVGRIGNKVTSAFGNIASEITGKQVFNPNSAHSIVIEALEKAKTSEALARRIWMSFVVEGNESLYPDDIAEVLGPQYREEAEECFDAIDADGNGDISLDEMIRKVVDIGKERKAIGNSMQDIGQALGVFDKILLFIVLLIVIFVFLAFFQSSFVTTLATAGTTLLSLSFIFAVTTQEFLGSCIFLFVKHPYDVGDRVDITGPEKEQLVVERISLLYTMFTRIDKMQVVQIPNIVLNNLWIENVSRSKAMKEGIDVNVSYDTTFEDIELLRVEMEKFVQSPENSRDFQPDIGIGVGGVGDLDKLTLKIAIKHKSNWHNDAIRATRRSKFICALALALKKVPIYAPGGGGETLGGPTNPSYSVTVSDAEAAAARDKAEKEKDAARLIPLAVSNEATEATAVQGLNTLDPLNAAMQEGSYSRDDDAPGDSLRRSTDRTRPNDADSASGPRKTPSQRSGLRKAGESVPAEPSEERTPSFQVTQHMTPFDEEAQMGGPNPFAPDYPGTQYNNPYSGAPSSNRPNLTQPQGDSSVRPGGASAPQPQNPNFQR